MTKHEMLAVSALWAAVGFGVVDPAVAAPPSAAHAPSSSGPTASPAPAPKADDHAREAPDPKSPVTEANKEPTATDDASTARNAARTRMRECGHQWSTMKKSGAASGLTWKDFSMNCLARR